MAPELAGLYSDAHTTDPTERAGQARLDALKHKISADPELAGRVHHYRLEWDRQGGRLNGLEAWGRQVLEALWAELEEETRDYAVQAPTTWEAQEREALAEFVQHKLRDFSGREALIARLLELAYAPAGQQATWGASLTGPPGSGKSALLARLYRGPAGRRSSCRPSTSTKRPRSDGPSGGATTATSTRKCSPGCLPAPARTASQPAPTRSG